MVLQFCTSATSIRLCARACDAFVAHGDLTTACDCSPESDGTEPWSHLPPPLYPVDPLGEHRSGATAINLDVDGDDVDEALLVTGVAGDPWFLFGRDGSGAIALLRLVAPPTVQIEDVAADPTTPGGVVWTGRMERGRAALTPPFFPNPEANAYGVAASRLVDMGMVESAGGLAVAAGQFDEDHLVGVAVGDARDIRVYRSVPTIE